MFVPPSPWRRPLPSALSSEWCHNQVLCLLYNRNTFYPSKTATLWTVWQLLVTTLPLGWNSSSDTSGTYPPIKASAVCTHTLWDLIHVCCAAIGRHAQWKGCCSQSDQSLLTSWSSESSTFHWRVVGWVTSPEPWPKAALWLLPICLSRSFSGLQGLCHTNIHR